VIELAHKANEQSTKLIGSIYYRGQPAYYQNYQNIGSFQALNVERVLSLTPDLVITWQGQTQPQTIEVLKRFGIKVAIFSANDLVELANIFIEIGEAIHLESAGKKLQRNFLSTLDKIIKESTNNVTSIDAEKPKVLLQLAEKPIFVAGGLGILNDIIMRCGGINIFQALNKISFETDINAVLQRNPAMIIMLSSVEGWHKTSSSMWQHWSSLAAVKNKHIFQLSSDGISQFSPQILSGVKNICDILSAVNSAAIKK
jgi:ABC-type Fe3+-hydroxamate transport system substrate-binding protein